MAFEFGEVSFNAIEDFVGFRRGFVGGRFHRKFLHGADDDSDEQIQDGKGGDHDEGDEEHPRPRIDFHDGANDAHGPAFEGHDLEKGIEAGTERAKPIRELFSEQTSGRNGAEKESLLTWDR